MHNPLRPPTTRSDPTLESWPPPRTHRFPTRSYGPAAAADITQEVTSIKALNRLASPSTDPRAPYEDDSRSFSKSFARWEGVERDDGKMEEDDPTWGLCMMLTDYSQTGRDNVDKAMENLLRLQERLLGANADPPNVYTDEMYRRMRFDVLEDQDMLEGASHERPIT
jgi:hypothetical protein